MKLWQIIRKAGAWLIAVVMAGAIYSHLSTDFGSPFHAARNLALLVVLAALRWPETRRILRRRDAAVERTSGDSAS